MTLELSYGSTLFTVLAALAKIAALLLGFGMAWRPSSRGWSVASPR